MSNDREDDASRSGWSVWLAGLVVVVAAGAATAHGLFEVALGSGTPACIAWLYPVITDGLALVAYAATGRLARRGRRYAWAVVVLAAGLSGLAQATYLAGSVGAAPPGLRFGVGAWPAIAAAIAAHLLFLIGGTRSASVSRPPSHRDRTGWDTDDRPEVTARVVPIPVPHALPSLPEADAPGGRSGCDAQGVGRPSDAVRPVSQLDRAREVARRHATRTGALPSVRDLAELAQVGRGTADRALSALRSDRNDSDPPPQPGNAEPDQ